MASSRKRPGLTREAVGSCPCRPLTRAEVADNFRRPPQGWRRPTEVIEIDQCFNESATFADALPSEPRPSQYVGVP